MDIIPVIDIKNGVVVHAIQGNREQYQAIQSLISSSSKAQEIIRALLTIHPFQQIYIADLNAIMRSGNNRALIKTLIEMFPKISFLIDDGNLSLHEKDFYNTARVIPVIASECLSASELPKLKQLSEPWILSLDFKGKELYAIPQLLDCHDIWPSTLILMTLERVGSQCGPDYEKLQLYLQRFPEYSIFAAGGVRDMRDIKRLQGLGIKAVLLASALHKGTITARDLSLL